jgi:filamentous hemagglutinin
MFTHLYRQSISCILSTVLLGNTLYAEGIVVDSTAAVKYRSMVELTANAIPLINIVTPNTSGLSHNKFTEFNIEQRGVIFNNATSAVQTQLGGWVQGNANLGTTPARVILNEVTGTSRSLLRGYGEVAGHRADLIIANPNGITVNGGGFINTPRATLTTGTPEFSGDTLRGFHVQRGDILIEGDGINASNIDQVELYTKALQLNAKIHAKKLDTVTGENTIARDGTVTSDNVIGTEEFSIDSSALGGIYADTIRLVGTDRGVGVNLPQITYASDSLELTVDGRIILGTAIAENTLRTKSASLTLNDKMYSSDIGIIATEAMTNKGELIAQTASITAQSLTNTSGAVISSTTLNMNVEEEIANAGSIIAHNGSMNADNMENSGSLIVDTANLDVVHSLTNTGVISGSEKITLHASDMTNSASAEMAAKEMEIVLSDNFSNSGEFISDTVSLNAHSLTNIGEMYGSVMSMELTDSITNQGTLSAFTELDLHTASLANQSGATLEATTLNAEATSGMNNQGMLRASALSLVTPTLTNNATILADTLAIEATNVTNNALLKGSDSAHITVNNTITNNGGIVGGNELAIHGRTITNNEVLYSANAIDLSASTTLRNTEGSLIKSADSITIHDTGTLRNEAARIEADGDIRIQAVTLENLSTTIPTKSSSSSTVSILDNFAPDWRDWRTTVTATETIDKTGYQPAYILSGGNMMINSATHNRYSMIAADGNLYLLGSLNNEAAINAHEVSDVSHYVEHYEKHGTFGHHAWYHNYSYYEHFDTIIDHLYSTIQAGGSIYGNLISVNNADVVSGSPVTNFSSQSIASPTVGSISSTGVTYRSTDTSAHNTLYRLPDGKYGEFVRVSNPALPYLIESNPLYTDFNTFISSDYIMSRLHLDTAANTKRLGDARYETQLVRDAVFRLTGERYLAGFGSDTTQYQSLMDNALAVSGDLNLELGVSLSASQVAALNRDIVWMEEREVSGQKVLVPVVYLASLKNQELTPGGKIIAGGDIQLAVSEGLHNGGEIRAGGTLLVEADSLTNTGGTIKSTSDMLLHTTNDITNTGGTISGDNVALVSDNGAIVSRTAIKSLDLGNRIGTSGNLSLAGERASIQASGDMLVSAKNDITLIGSETSAGGTIALESENVTLSALEQNTHYKTTWNKGSSEIESVKQHSSTLTASGDISIDAAKDVTVHSSNIAGNNVVLNAGENVNITASNDREFKDVHTSYKGTFGSGSSRDMSLKESVVSSSINGNNIAITSGKDTTLQAANLKAQENIQVNAAGDINILAQAYREASLHQESKSSFGGLVSSASLDSTDAIKLREAIVKTEAKNIIMNSGKDINVVASDVSAGDALSLSSTGDTNILAGQESSQNEHWSKKSGFFSGGGNIYSSEFDLKGNADITAKGSTLDGNTVTVTSGNDTRVQGSSVVGENDVALNAGKNLTIESANERHTFEELHESSGFGIYGSSGGLGFTIGQQAKKDALNNDATLQSQSRSLVGSINGDLTLKVADSVAVKGSDLVAGNDMSIQAKNVTLQESEDATKTKETHEFRQSGLTVALTGSVVSAAQTANQMNQASQKTDNDRLKALAAMTTGLGALSAYGDVAGSGTNAIGVSATIGNTQSKSESTSQSLVHSGSNATAGGDIAIIATGDGANSDITISGSDISAGKNITLKADDAITLTASQDTYSNRSSSSSSSGGVGVAATVGSGGGQLGFTANASMGRGRTNGDDALINNTHITANDTLTISSGGDTTLKGATAKAETIKADVGGNLAIESLQDTSTYASKSQNVGGSATVGWGGASGSVSYGQTDVKSDYASVNEQSGLNAGNGGFQINVANNTDLKGGVISSSQSAIDNNKNSLTTATLTTNDINNHADYKASSVSVSVGSDAGGVNISGAGAGFDKGSASGTTKSAISSANVTITDDAKQLSLTGQTAQETIASINTDTTNANQNITPIFDASKVTGEVEATAQIMQSFTQYAPKAVADYSSAKASELRKEGKEEEAKKWDEGGAYRVAAHTIVGGLAGDIAGALGAGTSAATIPAVGDMINSTDLPSEVKQTLVALAGTAIGAAAGATTGDGGALTGGATGYAQTVNNYLSEGQKDQRTKQLGSCQGNSDCVKAVKDYWNKIDNKTTMIGKIASDAWSGIGKGINDGVPEMWENTPWYAKGPLVHAGGITGLGVYNGGVLATGAFLDNPAAYTQGAIDVIEAYLPGPPPMSEVGIGATMMFMGYEHEDTIEGFKQSYEAVKKSAKEWFSK